MPDQNKQQLSGYQSTKNNLGLLILLNKDQSYW